MCASSHSGQDLTQPRFSDWPCAQRLTYALIELLAEVAGDHDVAPKF